MSLVWQKKGFQETWTRFGAGRKISTTSHQKVRFWAAKVSMELIWNICSWAKKDSITNTHESDKNWGTRFLGKLIWEDFFRTKILGFFHGFFLSFGFCSAEASRKPFSGLGKTWNPLTPLRLRFAPPPLRSGVSSFPNPEKVFENFRGTKTQNSKKTVEQAQNLVPSKFSQITS